MPSAEPDPPAAAEPDGADAPATRSGFIALAGRPNVGKSTLVNRIVGAKVAIVSDKPQTTRRAIRGVATQPAPAAGQEAWQLVLTDLPGVQRPRDKLTERMQARVESELAESDGVLFVVNGEQGVGGPGDKWIADILRTAGVPVVVVVNKADRLSNPKTVLALQAAADLGLDGEIFPVSARTGAGVRPLVDHLVSLLPHGPFFFPPEERSDQREDVVLAELVREQILNRTRQEVPHAVEVQVDEIEELDELVAIRATIWTETESQKGILIGAHGRMIKAIGIAARKEIERELGRRVHLDLSVRVRRSWRADERMLDRLGIG
jgi:GTP-binding protein Era